MPIALTRVVTYDPQTAKYKVWDEDVLTETYEAAVVAVEDPELFKSLQADVDKHRSPPGHNEYGHPTWAQANKDYERKKAFRAVTGDPGFDYYTSVTGIPVVEGSPYWDTVAGDPPLTSFDVDAILEEVRKFIDGIDAHLLSVDQRLKHHHKQRGE